MLQQCRRGTYQPGDSSSCESCGTGKYQADEGQSACEVCGAGNYSSNVAQLSCERCPVGEFCIEGASVGQRCPPGFTTKSRGAKSEAECGCYTGQYEIEVEGNRSCVPCSLSSMVCDEAAITVFELPVAPGYWRQHYWSAPGQKAPNSSNNGSVLACHTKEACLGGVNLSAGIFCSESQQGPYCAVCRDGFFGGGDGKLCTPCRGSSLLTFLPIIIILVLLFAALTNLLRTCCCGNAGFVWKNFGSEKPEGVELSNQKLEEALRSGKIKFTEDEWNSFGVSGLHSASFIKSGGCFFQPSSKEFADTVSSFGSAFTDALEVELDGSDATSSLFSVLGSVASSLIDEHADKEDRQQHKEVLKEALKEAKRDQGHIPSVFEQNHPKTSKCLRWLKDKWARLETKTRILIGLCQMLQGIGITFAIRWPDPYGEVINFLGSILQLDLPQAMPISCFATFGFSGSLVVRTAVPLLLMVLMHVLSRWLSHFKKHQAANACSSGCFFLIFLVYPGCSSAVFQTFICDKLDDGSRYLRVDYSVQCSESDEAGNAWTPEYVQVSQSVSTTIRLALFTSA